VTVKMHFGTCNTVKASWHLAKSVTWL